MKITFHFFDIRNNFDLEKIDWNFTDNKIKDAFFESLKPKKLAASELFSYYFFQSRGFIVKKLDPVTVGAFFSPDVFTFLKNNFKLDLDWATFCETKGVPDMLVYKKRRNEISDLCFVECKSINESISADQFFWISKTNVPTKIVFVDYGSFKQINYNQTKLEQQRKEEAKELVK